MTTQTLEREVSAPSEGATTGENHRAHEQAWGKAFVDGLVDKGIKEPLTGVLTIPGLNTLYKSVFDKDIPLPEKSQTKREGAEQFFYEGGGALGGLLIDAALLSAAKPLKRVFHQAQYRVGDAFRHGSWAVSDNLPRLGGLANAMDATSGTLLRTSGQTVLQQNLTQAIFAGGIKGTLFEVGSDPAHADWGNRLKHGLHSSAEWLAERAMAEHLGRSLTADGMKRYYGRLPVHDPREIAASAVASGDLTFVLDGVAAIEENRADPGPGLFGKTIGAVARGGLLGIREDRAFEAGMHNARQMLRFNGGRLVAWQTIRV